MNPNIKEAARIATEIGREWSVIGLRLNQVCDGKCTPYAAEEEFKTRVAAINNWTPQFFDAILGRTGAERMT